MDEAIAPDRVGRLPAAVPAREVPVERWSLRLLGPFVAERGGEALGGFRSDKVRALLVILALHPDRPWPRATLADMLWPEHTERTARANLRNALANLRRVLAEATAPQPFLTITEATVTASSAAGGWTDVGAFRSVVPRGDATAESLADPDAVARLGEALALVRGELLQGFTIDSAPFESWLADEREGLARDARWVAQLLTQAQALLGDDDASAVGARRWLSLDPWNEAAHRHLMQLHLRRGDRAAALAQFDACRRSLLEDLGAEPEAATRQLAEQARSEPPIAAGGPAAPTWPGLSRRASPAADVAFVARHRELDRLQEALSTAAGGQGHAGFVTGEPGSGKTALLAEFAGRALNRDPHLLVLWGSCSAFTGRGDPYEPFRHAARMLSGETEAPPAARAAGPEAARRLRRRLPDTIAAFLQHGPDLFDRFVTTRRLGAHGRRHSGVPAADVERLERDAERRGPGGTSARAPAQAALLGQFANVIRDIGRHRPLVLLLDDLQWIDAASVDLLFTLGRSLAGSRVLLVGAYRPEELRRDDPARPILGAVDELRATHAAFAVDLGARDPGFVDALIDTEPNALPRSFRTRLQAHTGGNPLFTIELLRGMQLRGELRRDDRGRWVERPDLRWDELPGRVESVIARRLAHLTRGCADLLRTGAIEGEEFTAAIAAAAAGMPLEHACELLSEEAGHRHRLVVAGAASDLDGRPVARYRFRHGLFPTYLVQNLDPVERAGRHAKVARELARALPNDPVARDEAALPLARHFEAAGLLDQAADHYAAAARHAQRLSAHADAIALLRSALNLLAAQPPGPARDRRELALQLALGPPLTASRGWAPAELAAAHARAQELTAGLEDDASLVPVLWSLSVFRIGRSEHAVAHELAERMRRLADASRDPTWIALTRLDITFFYRGRFAAARAALEEAAASPDAEMQRVLAQRFGMAPAVLALAYLAECLWLLGHPEEAASRGAEAIAWADRLGHPMTRAYAHSRACWRAAIRGVDGELAAHATTLQDIAATYGLEPFVLAATFFGELAALRICGREERDADGRLGRMRTAIDRYLAAGTTLNRTAFLTLWAQACAAAGRPDEGLVASREALATAARSGESWFQAETWRVTGELLASNDANASELARASGLCRERARRVARRQGAVAFEQRATERTAVSRVPDPRAP